ncbi:MAG: M28 family peptidase [Candidatus Dormibacteraceae bacterium]
MNPEALLEHVRALSKDFPHRHAGEPDEKRAADYIAKSLTESGLKVQILEVPVMGWELTEEPILELIGADREVTECAPYIFSGSTPADGIEGQLVYIGKSVIASGFEWEKFAIVDDDGQWRALVVGRPDGPAIAQCGPPAGLAGAVDTPLYTWPACTVGSEALTRIDRLRKTGTPLRARYRCQARFKPGVTSTTVIGEVLGNREPSEVIILGSHHDAQGALGFPAPIDSPGANDNASAVGIFLEMARHYAKVGSSKTLWFCFFGGEERNLMMSRDFARRLIDTGDINRLIAYVGIDQAANGDIIRLLASTIEPHIRPAIDMREILGVVAKRLEVTKRFETIGPAQVHAASDHWPFYFAGVPSFLTGWHPFPTYHRSGDSLEYCDNDEKYLTTANLAIGMLEALLLLGPQHMVPRPLTAGHVTTAVSLTQSQPAAANSNREATTTEMR